MFAWAYEKGVDGRYDNLIDISNDQERHGVRGNVVGMCSPIVCEECELAFGGKDASLLYKMSSSSWHAACSIPERTAQTDTSSAKT